MTDFDQPLLITSTPDGSECVVTLVGELDPHTSPLLEREIDEGLSGGAQRLVLDLAELRFIDSSGLRVIIKAYKELEKRGGELILRSPNETAMRLFEITDLVDHFTIEGAR
jgi:anti-anti-sigma factor